jgi:REP element-mobilizing transposase RayT
MSTRYKFHNPEGVYFISFATVGWTDVFVRAEYKEIFVESLKHCQEHKGLELFGWCLMSSHAHLLARAKEGHRLSEIMRDLKKYTSKQIINAIEQHPQESRKEWLLTMFRNAGGHNPNNTKYQFWRQDNHPIETFSSAVIRQKLDHIHQNPVKEGIVLHPEQYVYSSASNYFDGTGLLKIEPITG